MTLGGGGMIGMMSGLRLDFAQFCAPTVNHRAAGAANRFDERNAGHDGTFAFEPRERAVEHVRNRGSFESGRV